MRTLLRLTYFLFFTGLTLVGVAQSDYVVLTTGDTLRGNITILRPEGPKEKVSVKTEQGTRTYSANRLRSLFVKNETYKSLKHGSHFRIMKEYISGPLSLYRFRYEGGYEFSSKYLLKNSGQGLEVPSLRFRKTLSKFLSDCTPMSEALLEDKSYSFKKLERVVDEYNTKCFGKEAIAAATVKTPENVTTSSVENLKMFHQHLGQLLTLIELNAEIPEQLVESLRSYQNKNLNTMLEEVLSKAEKN